MRSSKRESSLYLDIGREGREDTIAITDAVAVGMVMGHRRGDEALHKGKRFRKWIVRNSG